MKPRRLHRETISSIDTLLYASLSSIGFVAVSEVVAAWSGLLVTIVRATKARDLWFIIIVDAVNNKYLNELLLIFMIILDSIICCLSSSNS